MKNFIITLLTTIITAQSISAQNQNENFDDLMDMSLEELMQVEVYSVSKKKESLFEAPLSSSIITSIDILNAGVTNIPEALRLIPGMIVREVSNGNYDIHIRGFDNLNRYTDASTGGNSITLVMIDGRPVFNNNTGGVFWESLPIDLIDIERIEVVRGPAAALYGPNAVSGVINIITKETKEKGFYSQAQANYGVSPSLESAVTTAGIRMGYKTNDKFNITLSANLQDRDRLDDEYYSYYDNEYVKRDSLRSTYGLNNGEYLNKQQQAYAFPNDNQSLSKQGVNLFADYAFNDELSFDLQTGYQEAASQRIFRQNSYTPLSVVKLSSYYGSLQMKAYGFNGRASYINGDDNINSIPYFLPTGDTLALTYVYENVDGYLEYEWKASDKLSIVPGLSYQRSTYSDEALKQEANQIGILGGKKTIRTFSASTRIDYTPNKKLRFIAAGRTDQFTVPNDVYFSYELAASYKINDNNFLRTVVSRSNSGAFMAQTFTNINEDYTFTLAPTISFDGTARFNGNQELDLFQLQLFELGYRSRLLENLEIDIELFHQRSKNSNEIINDKIPDGYFADISNVQYFENLNIVAKQWGTTFAINYLPINSIQIKPFITIQQTVSEGFPLAYNSVERDASININTTDTRENDQTPAVFGGINVNYQPTSKWNINFNAYYFEAHQQYNTYDQLNRFANGGEIQSNFISNLNLSYAIADFIKVNINARNLTNNSLREYYAADRKSSVFMAGLNVAF